MSGSSEKAAAALTQAATLAAETNNPVLSNSVCRSGGMGGFAEIVLPACEHAVRLADDEHLADCRDSRGLARALTGDYAGAVEDFRYFVAHWEDEELVAQRQAWIAELEADRNPFDEETLEALRNP